MEYKYITYVICRPLKRIHTSTNARLVFSSFVFSFFVLLKVETSGISIGVVGVGWDVEVSDKRNGERGYGKRRRPEAYEEDENTILNTDNVVDRSPRPRGCYGAMPRLQCGGSGKTW